MEGGRRTVITAPGGAVRKVLPVLLGSILAVTLVVGAPVTRVTKVDRVNAAATFADPFFREFPVFTGLTRPVSVRFASDGRAFVAEKAGIVKAFDSVTDTSATTVIDIRASVNNYWDRGLLGIALDPDFLSVANPRPFLYLYYVYDAPPGQLAPYWNDACPAPPAGPGGTTDGCVVTSRLDRVRIDLATNQAVPDSRVQLIEDWCQQFPSHSGGGIAFGPDKQLYLAAGDGANFNTADYGQKGGTIPDATSPYTPINPCGDPLTVTSPPGSNPTIDVATAEGGSLRTMDVRTTADPTGLDGTIIRIDPATGAASAGNPLASSADANTRRIVAHGFRNPFRMTFRPGASDLYVANVGNQTWEEIERVAIPTTALTATTLPNFGWPCYEGVGAAPTWQSLGNNMCNALYAQGPTAVTEPLYTYSHFESKPPTGPCFVPDAGGKMGGSPTGVAFYTGASGTSVAYPSRYTGALFYVDYTRDCLAAIPAGAGGVPDPAQVQEISRTIDTPVDLVAGPGGDLFYVSFDGGRVTRIRYVIAPNARATVAPTGQRAPVTVQLDGSTSTDPDPNFSLVAWRWDLDDDGQYDDATGQTHNWSITTPAVYPVSLQVESSSGLTDTVDLVVDASNSTPVPVIGTPLATLTWSVGDTIAFSGSASDAEDGTIDPGSLEWELVMLHCSGECHEHVIESFTGAGGSFTAPDHEYPSHLGLRLVATDSHGVTGRTSIELMPKTATINVATVPTGVPVSVGGDPVVSPSSTTLIANSVATVSAPLMATIDGKRYRFSRWADSTERVRDITASGPVSLTATYVPDAYDTCSSAASTTTGSWHPEHASGYGDVDWFRFTLTSKRRVVITAGDLPVNARLDLYSSCSTRLTGIDTSGNRYEELTRVLAAGTYRIRMTYPAGTRSDAPYALRFRPMASGMPLTSTRVTSGAGGGGTVRIVGEVLNNTGASRGRATVKATFKDGAGRTVATLSGLGFARRMGNGGVTPFVISGYVPAYSSISYSVSTSTLPASRRLSLVTLTRTVNADGSVTERGTVKNTGTSTATRVMVGRTWYDQRGQILDRGYAYVSPSTLGPGRTGSFTVVRPAMPGVQGTRTQFRAT